LRIRVKFNNDLKDQYAPDNADGIVELFLKGDFRIADVFETLRIDDREVGFVLLNEKKVQKDANLSDGDFIHIFSLVDGG
jgi:sulfur carrier protein ThiS